MLSCYSTGTETALTQQLGFVLSFCLQKPHPCSPSHPFVTLCLNKVPTTSPCAVINTLTSILSWPGAWNQPCSAVRRHFCGTWLFQDTHGVKETSAPGMRWRKHINPAGTQDPKGEGSAALNTTLSLAFEIMVNKTVVLHSHCSNIAQRRDACWD